MVSSASCSLFSTVTAEVLLATSFTFVAVAFTTYPCGALISFKMCIRDRDDADEQEESTEPEILRDEDFDDNVLEDEEEEQE